MTLRQFHKWFAASYDRSWWFRLAAILGLVVLVNGLVFSLIKAGWNEWVCVVLFTILAFGGSFGLAWLIVPPWEDTP